MCVSFDKIFPYKDSSQQTDQNITQIKKTYAYKIRINSFTFILYTYIFMHRVEVGYVLMDYVVDISLESEYRH